MDFKSFRLDPETLKTIAHFKAQNMTSSAVHKEPKAKTLKRKSQVISTKVHITDEQWKQYKEHAKLLSKKKQNQDKSINQPKRRRIKAKPAVMPMSLAEEWRKENHTPKRTHKRAKYDKKVPSAQDLEPYDLAGMDEMRNMTIGGGRKRTLEWNDKIALHNKKDFLEESKRMREFFEDESHH